MLVFEMGELKRVILYYLKALEEDEVHFEFTDQLSPGVVKVKHPFLYVIMPMRTS